MKPPVQFGEIGQALYGSFWQYALAEALNIPVQTVQRYVAGETVVPPERWDQIVELLRLRQAEIGDLLARISPPPAAPPKRRSEPEGWQIAAWTKATGLSRGTVYKLMDSGEVKTAKVLKRRFIMEPPQDFLARHSRGGPPE